MTHKYGVRLENWNLNEFQFSSMAPSLLNVAESESEGD